MGVVVPVEASVLARLEAWLYETSRDMARVEICMFYAPIPLLYSKQRL